MNPYLDDTTEREAWAFGYGDADDPATVVRPIRLATTFDPAERIAWRKGARACLRTKKASVALPPASGLPMPNDKLADERIVIASCHGRDMGDEHDWNALLLLNPTPGSFYSVVQVSAIDGRILNEQVFPNIVPAAREYEEQSGPWGDG